MAQNKRSPLRKAFPTAHKLLLDKGLNEQFPRITGDVLVLGAGHEPYQQLLNAAQTVLLTDIDTKNSEIDLAVDAHRLPFADQSFDTVLAIEVLEHLKRPAVASTEVWRVLRPGGLVLVSIPFMFRIHGDPSDFQRLTASGLKELFSEFSEIKVTEFGSRTHVISDLATTALPFCVILRILNHLLAMGPLGKIRCLDCPSGYLALMIK